MYQVTELLEQTLGVKNKDKTFKKRDEGLRKKYLKDPVEERG